MTAAARNRLAELLGKVTPAAAFSVQRTAPVTDLRLDADGMGRVRLPVSEQQAHRLANLCRSARFGRGEATLTDSRVRDTSEVTSELGRADWGGALEPALGTPRAGLGPSPSCGARRRSPLDTGL